MKQVTPPRVMRFGAFEVDPWAGELRKHGIRMKLRDQPFQILLMLLERPGEVVTREELRAKLWPADTFVDFDHGLNAAVNKLREALGESAEAPRYVETLPRRGYRFLLTPDSPAQAPAGPAAVHAPAPAATQVTLPSPRRWWYRGSPALAVVFLLVLVGSLVFALKNSGLRARVSRNAATTRIESLAVLPLENLSKEPEQEYFVEGMTDQLTTNLAKISALRVISRTSATRYRGTHKSLADIARELNVDAVVEGTVLRSGERVRITAQLIQAATDRHLWAESYEGSLSDILVLQNRVAQDIAEQIRVKLTPQEQQRLGRTNSVNPEAYEAYLKGRYFWNRRTPEALQKAIEYFQRAVDNDRSYVLAYSGLADSYNMLGDYSYVAPGEAFPRALALAGKALDLDDTLAEAHSSLAFAKLFYERDWAAAEHHFKRAIELNPNYAPAHQWYAINYLLPLKRLDQSFTEVKRAQQLDPLSLIINASVGWHHYQARQYDQAIEQYRKTLELDPNFVAGHLWLGQAYEQKAMFEEALREFQKAKTISAGSTDTLAALGHAYAVAGNKVKAQEVLEELKRQSKRKYVSAYRVAEIYAGLGEKEQTFAWLQKAYEQRSAGYLIYLSTEPRLDSLRPDPRFQDLVRRIGLPP